MTDRASLQMGARSPHIVREEKASLLGMPPGGDDDGRPAADPLGRAGEADSRRGADRIRFPAAWEDKLRRFDDCIISAAQAFHGSALGRVLKLLALALTAFTMIEVGAAAPMVLYISGYGDSYALAVLCCVFMTAFLSQLPKRFLWRPRPYHVGRAIKCRTNLTSSFPSRAVTCGVVYSYLVTLGIVSPEAPFAFSAWFLLPVLVTALLSSFARVNLGVHYPSDCVGGLLQGSAAVVLGLLLAAAIDSSCLSCALDLCYATSQERKITSASIPWVGGLSGCAIAAVLFYLARRKPLVFWDKSSHVFGLLLPCFVFHFTFLCPPLNVHADSISKAFRSQFWDTILGLVVVAVASAVGFRTRKKRPVMGYAIVYTLALLSICIRRLDS